MAAHDTVEIELVVMVDEDGQWEVGRDTDDLLERWNDNIGEIGPGASRFVRVKLKVPAPRAVELEAEVPAEPAGGELKVA
jgi:hypothetical protein